MKEKFEITKFEREKSSEQITEEIIEMVKMKENVRLGLVLSTRKENFKKIKKEIEKEDCFKYDLEERGGFRPAVLSSNAKNDFALKGSIDADVKKGVVIAGFPLIKKETFKKGLLIKKDYEVEVPEKLSDYLEIPEEKDSEAYKLSLYCGYGEDDAGRPAKTSIAILTNKSNFEKIKKYVELDPSIAIRLYKKMFPDIANFIKFKEEGEASFIFGGNYEEVSRNAYRPDKKIAYKNINTD